MDECEQWAYCTPEQVPQLQQLMNAENVMTRLSGIGAQYLQHMHRYRHAVEQMPAGVASCVVAALASVRFAALLISEAMAVSTYETAEDKDLLMRLKMTRVVARETGNGSA